MKSSAEVVDARRDHILRTETHVPRPREEVFEFFASADNLQRITPPELDFEIRTPRPIEMQDGALIDYRLKLFGISFAWKTRISLWDPPTTFVDEQIAGPYKRWIHTHTFTDVACGTRVNDTVRYRLPLYPIGEAAFPLVRRQLGRIFTYRSEQLREILG